MIISRSHADRLVRQGKAIKDGYTYISGKRYQIVIRRDKKQIDHHILHPRQSVRIAVH